MNCWHWSSSNRTKFVTRALSWNLMTAIHLFPKEIDKHENVCYSVLDIYSKIVYMVYLLKFPTPLT